MTAAVKNVGEEEEEDGQLDSSVPAPLRRVRMLRMGQTHLSARCSMSRITGFFFVFFYRARSFSDQSQLWKFLPPN